MKKKVIGLFVCVLMVSSVITTASVKAIIPNNTITGTHITIDPPNE